MEGTAHANMTPRENFTYINYELNRALAADYLFVTVLIAVLLISGVFGNLLVIKVYYFNIRVDPLSGRAFLPALAVMDLLACVAGSTIYMVQNLQPASFSGDALCKFYYVLAYSCTMGASIMLVIISVYRHRKVCTPFKKQFPVLLVKLSPFIAGVTGLIMTLPMIPVVGEFQYRHKFYKQHGQKCTVLYNTTLKVYFWIYFVVIASVFFGTCVVISFISFRIHRIIKKQIQFRKSSMTRSDTSFSPNPQPSGAEESESEQQSSSRSRGSRKSLAHGTLNGTLKQAVKPRHKREKREYAVMFLLISIVYVATWLPTLVVNGVKVLSHGIEEHSAPPVYITLRFLNSLFTLNNVANPFIYFKFDREFRKHFLSFRCKR